MYKFHLHLVFLPSYLMSDNQHCHDNSVFYYSDLNFTFSATVFHFFTALLTLVASLFFGYDFLQASRGLLILIQRNSMTMHAAVLSTVQWPVRDCVQGDVRVHSSWCMSVSQSFVDAGASSKLVLYAAAHSYCTVITEMWGMLCYWSLCIIGRVQNKDFP